MRITTTVTPLPLEPINTEASPSEDSTVQQLQRHWVGRILKRGFDLVASIMMLTVFSFTLFPLVALAIMLESKGSPLFVQRRMGRGRTVFKCYKLRTMTEPNGKEQSDEERITALGRVLRAIHIDELPQLANVVLGQMSLVGPRPHSLPDTMKFELAEPNYHLRHAVRPGITGLAQVHGFYGTVTDSEHLHQRTAYDIEYVHRANMVMDLRIIWKTTFVPIRQLF